MPLAKHYLFSDMDGTLIGAKKEIPQPNLEAILTFIQRGGKFIPATGRSAEIAKPFLCGIPLLLPAILCNGAAVYDFSTAQYVKQWLIPAADTHAIVKAAHRAYPGVCSEIIDERPIQLVNPNRTIMDSYIQAEGQPAEESSLERCGACMKVLFFGEHAELVLAQQEILRCGVQNIVTCFSAPFYLEVLPVGATKGDAMRWMCRHYAISLEDTAAIGDFDNDITMLEAASLSAAPENAPASVKRHADVVVAHHSVGAVGDFLTQYLL